MGRRLILCSESIRDEKHERRTTKNAASVAGATSMAADSERKDAHARQHHAVRCGNFLPVNCSRTAELGTRVVAVGKAVEIDGIAVRSGGMS